MLRGLGLFKLMFGSLPFGCSYFAQASQASAPISHLPNGGAWLFRRRRKKTIKAEVVLTLPDVEMPRLHTLTTAALDWDHAFAFRFEVDLVENDAEELIELVTLVS